jgi:hypothetical protein
MFQSSVRSKRLSARSGIAAMAVCSLGLLFLLPSVGAAPEKSFVLKPGVENLTLIGVKAEAIDYRGRKAIHISETPGNGETMAVIKDLDFKDGTIELEITGTPSAGAPETARGFVGIAFRIAADNDHFECFYLRPTNGRADDQLRRNHSTQYVSEPDYPWERLRKENPGVYESYVDLEPGVWTKYKLAVSSRKAALYVHGAEQPCLIVNDLKGAQSHGKIALWIGSNAEGYFSDLKVTQAP